MLNNYQKWGISSFPSGRTLVDGWLNAYRKFTIAPKGSKIISLRAQEQVRSLSLWFYKSHSRFHGRVLGFSKVDVQGCVSSAPPGLLSMLKSNPSLTVLPINILCFRWYFQGITTWDIFSMQLKANHWEEWGQPKFLSSAVCLSRKTRWWNQILLMQYKYFHICKEWARSHFLIAERIM